MNSLLALSGLESTTLTATETASTTRDQLLGYARMRPAITDADTATRCAAILTDIKNFTRKIEAARVDVKAPVLDVGKQIDALAKELTAALEGEATTISRQLGAFQAEENRKAEEIRQKAFAEERRIRQEADAREREAVDKARKESEELAAKAARARTEAGRAKAEAEAAKAKERADAEAQVRADREREAIVANRVSAAAVMPARPAGVSTREEICFEVTDAVALYEAAPFLVTLTPNNAAIKAALKGLTGEQKLPGIRHWKENKAVVR